MPPYQWNNRRSAIWALHVLAVAPLLYFFRDNLQVLTVVLAATAAYHAYRLSVTHGCKDSYAELNVFHLVFALPVLFFLVYNGHTDALALVALLVAVYFVAKFVLYAKCTGIPPHKNMAP